MFFLLRPPPQRDERGPFFLFRPLTLTDNRRFPAGVGYACLYIILLLLLRVQVYRTHVYTVPCYIIYGRHNNIVHRCRRVNIVPGHDRKQQQAIRLYVPVHFVGWISAAAIVRRVRL